MHPAFDVEPLRSRRSHFENGVYHGSIKHPHQYLEAPMIHVGTYGSAHVRVHSLSKSNFSESDKWFNPEEMSSLVKRYRFHPEAKVYPHIFSDRTANSAQMISSHIPKDGQVTKLDDEEPDAMTAAQLLNKGTIIAYSNTVENLPSHISPNRLSGPKGELYVPEVSFVVPKPKLNLIQFGN